MFSAATTRRARRGMLREWRLHALSVFSLAVAFVCLGAALLVVTNLRSMEERWAHAGRASVYLRDGVTTEEIESATKALSATSGIVSVRYVSAQQARADFATRMGEQRSPLAALPTEAFPSTLELEVSPDLNERDLGEVAAKLRLLPIVEDVETYQTWTTRLARVIRGGVAASALLAVVVLGAVLAVVGSTIRLALQRRRTEVEVLRLVGATDRFVKSPFILEGSIQGALGAIGAVGLLALLFIIVRARLDQEFVHLLGVQPAFLPWYAIFGLIATGASLGATAAHGSLRKLVTL